ncbi:hypothetical protein JG688_00012599 [Phytophthora aleatoria]|uniref:Uncharacterized protein n=1 Tax=Phytophthora aleatoria TaxID=2496075 RepID=A0A8J5IK33_9STRA|nr:hypothetical protein JG688_00012599 [Phytophthora aleatoria]
MRTWPTTRAKGGGFGPKQKAPLSPKERQIIVHHHSAAQCIRMKKAMMRIREIVSMERRRYPCGVINEFDAGYLANGRNATTDEISLSGDFSGESFDDEANNEFE